MPATAQEIPGDPVSNDAEFRKLAQEHSRYEEQLHQLTRQPYVSSEDIVLEAQIKKLKLRIKDEMQRVLARHRRASPAT